MVTYRNMTFFLISSMLLGLLCQLQICWRLYLIELIGLLTGLGLLSIWSVALDIYPRLLTGFGMLVFFKPKSHGISCHIFGLISSFLSNRQLQVILDGKGSQEYPVNAGVPHGSILGPSLFLLYIKGTVMQIEKAQINDRLRVSKVSSKFRILTFCHFTVSFPWNLLFS